MWDDNHQVVANPDLRAGAPIARLFSSDVWRFSHPGSAATNNYYRPLQMVTYRATAALAGFDPFAFHLISLLFVVATVIAALAVFQMFTGRLDVSVAAAALFAVHPVHTETVDWISALPDAGCTLFVLGGLALFLLGYKRDDPQDTIGGPAQRRWLWWTLSLACFAAALLWKETAAVFPFLICAFVLLFSKRNSGLEKLADAARTSLPYWLVLGAYLFVRSRALGFIATSQRDWMLTPFQIALTLPQLIASYCWKLIEPFPLNAYHVFSPVLSPSDPRAAAVLLLVGAIVAAVFVASRRALLVFAGLWIFITLLPAMDIYAVGRNVFAERYLYLPSVGFCLLVVLAAQEASRWIPQPYRKAAWTSILAAVVLLCAWTTVARNPDWKDDATLFTRTLETSPNAPFVLNMVAASQRENSVGRQSAEEHYSSAAKFAAAEHPPDRLQMTIAYEGLAWIYSERSDFAGSLEVLRRVREINPADPEVDGEEGIILVKAGKWQQAEASLQRAVANSHENENVLNALGIIAWQHNHQPKAAAEYFGRALAKHPQQDDFAASLHNSLGAVYADQGRYVQATTQFQSAVAITPDDPEYRTNLAAALAASGRPDDARSEVGVVLSIAPNYDPARELVRQLEKLPQTRN